MLWAFKWATVKIASWKNSERRIYFIGLLKSKALFLSGFIASGHSYSKLLFHVHETLECLLSVTFMCLGLWRSLQNVAPSLTGGSGPREELADKRLPQTASKPFLDNFWPSSPKEFKE